MVATLLQRTAAAQLCTVDRLLLEYDRRTNAAWDRFAAALPAGSADEAREVLRDCLLRAQTAWDRLLAAAEGGQEAEWSTEAQRLRGTFGAGIVEDVGAEGPERPQRSPTPSRSR